MNPEQLAKSGTEHAEQTALFCWAAMATHFGFECADDMRNYAGPQKYTPASDRITPVPELRWLHAIPNAGARGNKVAASQLKAEGVKAGVADILLPVRRTVRIDQRLAFASTYSGFYLEMKRANGRLSDVTKEQSAFAEFVKQQGYYWNVAFGWRMAADMLTRYLQGR